MFWGGKSKLLFADYDLAQRLENVFCRWSVSYAESQASLFPETGATAIQVGGGVAVFAGVASPVTKAAGLGMNGPVTPEEMDLLHDFYSSRGVAAAVELCPFADPSFTSLLGERGYGIDYFLNMWIRELPGAPLPVTLGNVEVHQASEAEAATWIETVAKGFEETEHPEPGHLITPRIASTSQNLAPRAPRADRLSIEFSGSD